MNEIGEMGSEERDFGEGEGFEHLEDRFGGSFIGLLKRGGKDADD